MTGHCVGRVRRLHSSHPLTRYACPVCVMPLATHPFILFLTGRDARPVHTYCVEVVL